MFPSTNVVFCEAPTSRATTLSSQGTNLVFRSTKSKETNPSNSEAPTPRSLTLWFFFVKKCFDCITMLSKSSSLCSVNLQLHCYISGNLSSYEGFFTILHISQIESAKLPHDHFK